MGLDWKPLNKPKQGFDQEYADLFLMLTGQKKKEEIPFWGKLLGKKPKTHDQLLERFLSISSPAYETLGAPCVGKDQAADEWMKGNFENRTNKNQNMEEFLASMAGYYVVDLVPENDGIPVYIAFHDEAHIFRGKFLHSCEELLGPQLLEEAYTSHLAPEALTYGKRLLALADETAKKENAESLRDQRMPPEEDTDGIHNQIHILYAAAKWVIWWAERGHGFEADY